MSRDFTVHELNTTAGEMLSMAFPEPVWVRGVVALARKPSSTGHVYFQIADPCPEGSQSPASADCALFAGDRVRITRELGRQGMVLDLSDGMEARFLVTPSIYGRTGRFSYIVRGFDPEYAGSARALHLKRLVDKLEREGVLGENGTLPFPLVPLTVGLVTSRDSAASEDFFQTLRESGYPFRVLAAWASMQGKDTAVSVTRALVSLLGTDEPPDLVVLTRGGGSPADLAWFNDETIARTISQLPFPVISGIGHETDMTLPDFASHTRAKTPTHAAMILVDRVATFCDSILDICRRLNSAVVPRLSLERLRISRSMSSLEERCFRPFSERRDRLTRATALIQGRVTPKVSDERRRSDLLASRLAHGFSRLVARETAHLDRMDALTARRDPERMLALGWAIAVDSRGKTLPGVEGVRPGDPVSLRLWDGKLETRVEKVEKVEKR